MTEYITKQDKNGKTRYYRVEDGKKTAIKKAEYDTNTAQNASQKTGIKQNRWVKVHEQGHGNFESKENVIDVTVGTNRAQAEVLYATRQVKSFEKAAYWLLHSLGVVNASEIVNLANEQISTQAQNTPKDEDQMTVDGNGWTCTIDNMGDGKFKAQLSWVFSNEEDHAD